MADRDAAFREAVDVLIVAARFELPHRVDAAVARVLALYAERQGEVMEIVGHRYHTDGRPTLTIAGLYGEKFQTGDKVRVTKVEEGT